MECKAGSYIDADCDTAGFVLTTADASGTVTLDYRVKKGPLAAHHIVCSAAQPCEIGVAGGDGKAAGAAVANLDFG
jgi:hypothetical protein